MDLKSEVRKGYTISSEMKAIWVVQLQMVKHLLSICNQYGLKIWADGGTLLGTIREKGYIPWDDDIDLLMFREDYDKLIDIADLEFTPPYHLQSFGRDKNYYRGHAQIRCDGTSAILPGDIWQPFHQGIFIDVFVYDSIPNDCTSDWENTLKEADKIQAILTSLSFRGRMSSVKLCLETVHSILYCMIHGKKRLIKKYDDLFRKFASQDSNIAAPSAFYRTSMQCPIMEKEWYKETIYLPFEDIDMPVPKDFEKVLRAQYGDDYMTPKKEPSIHGTVFFDTKRDYREVIKELRKKRLLSLIKHFTIK